MPPAATTTKAETTAEGTTAADDAKKRKAEAEAKGAPKNKKMTKEEKAAARERARVAMMEDSSAPEKVKKKAKATTSATTSTPATKTATPAKATKAATKAPATTKKKATASSASKPASKVTISDEKPMEMPLPPTSLQRTQSTPLELELEHQVVANLKADMEGKDPVFTQAPPAHLLKFAPTELEEGYDHDENNAGDPDDKSEAAQQGTGRAVGQRPAVLPTTLKSGSNWIMECLVIGIWLYLFWGREGTFYHRWSHGIMARIPLPGNPYRHEGKPLPFLPCFKTNIDDPPLEMRPECEGLPTVPCPPFGECYGGHLQFCSNASPYLEMAPNHKQCQMLPSIAKIYNHVVSQTQAWSMDYHCDRKAYAKLFENYPESPAPYMMASMRETSPPTKQPMFALEYILDLEPFLLMKVPGGGYGRNPTQSLHHVIEVANAVADHWLKLQVLTKYGDMVPGTDNREVHQVYLVARVPTRDVWWRSQLSLPTQCSLLRTKATMEYAMRTPWLIGVWVACMIIFVVWVFVMRHYWMKAQQQQHVLAAIEVVRNFVLETLQQNPSRKWKGPELLEYVMRNGPTAYVDDEPLYRKRIWPRVVFDIRGNPNVNKAVIVSGADLLDVWNWQPREQQAPAQAPNETGGA